jgi:hypothetical protein
MWPGSGFITVILYALGVPGFSPADALLTENNLNILTETSQDILTET